MHPYSTVAADDLDASRTAAGARTACRRAPEKTRGGL